MSVLGWTKQKSICVVVPPNAIRGVSSSGPSVNIAPGGCIVTRLDQMGVRLDSAGHHDFARRIDNASRLEALVAEADESDILAVDANVQWPTPCGVTTSRRE